MSSGRPGQGQLPAEWANAALSAQILETLQDIKEILLRTYVYPRGTTFTSILHLKSEEPVTRIDFIDAKRHRNIPMGRFETGGQDLITIYGVPVSRLIIYNTGPDGMYFDTNRNYGDDTANTAVYVNSSYEVPADIPSIGSINLKCENAEPGGPQKEAKVRLTAII